jgi:hypothetical protein
LSWLFWPRWVYKTSKTFSLINKNGKSFALFQKKKKTDPNDHIEDYYCWMAQPINHQTVVQI